MSMGSLYSPYPTWLHRVPAGAKLAAVAVLGTGLLLLRSPVPLAACAAAAAVLWCSLGPATRVARRLMLTVLVAALAIALFHVGWGDARLGWASALRLACASSLGIALTVTTSPTQLLAVLDQMLAPLGRIGLPVHRLALQLALMLRFIAHFFVQWQRLDDAYRLRTGRAGGWRLMAPLCIQMLQTARRVADALYARLGG